MKDRKIQYHNSIIEAAAQLTRTFKEITRALHKEYDLEITHEEFLLLETIYLNPGIIQIDIAKKILMKRSYVCKFLTELEEKGFIHRENAIRGKRQIILKNFITERGNKIYKKVLELYTEKSEEIATDYEFEELAKAALIMLDVSSKAKKLFKIKV